MFVTNHVLSGVVIGRLLEGVRSRHSSSALGRTLRWTRCPTGVVKEHG